MRNGDNNNTFIDLKGSLTIQKSLAAFVKIFVLLASHFALSLT